jgi:hypothetical protein
MGKCQCGCNRDVFPDRRGRGGKFIKGHSGSVKLGRDHPKWSGPASKDGYDRIFQPDNPRADNEGCVLKHILIAEKALGKSLPEGAHVHHANGSRNSGPLVICQDEAYHRLIERRTRAFKTCGHADWRKCPFCKRYDKAENMVERSSGYGYFHSSCFNEYQQKYRKGKK